MNKSTKAALLSAFVFPGVGHLFLKVYVTGVLLIGVSIVSVYFFMTAVFEMATQLAEKIQSADIHLDNAELTGLVSQELAASNDQSLGVATMILLLCWVIAIIDSFRVGYMQEKE